MSAIRLRLISGLQILRMLVQTVVGRLMQLDRRWKQVCLLSYDLVCLVLSLWLAIMIRLGEYPAPIGIKELAVVAVTLGASATVFLRLGLYRAVVRFMGQQAIIAIVKAVTASALCLAISAFLAQAFLPRSIPFLYGSLAFLFIGGSRFLVRMAYQSVLHSSSDNVIIYGAGAAGRQLLTALMHGGTYRVVLFVDDDESVQGSVINGVPVLAPAKMAEAISLYDIKHVLLALASADRERRRQIIESLMNFPVHVRTIPSAMDLVSGKADIDEIQDIVLEDLLGRAPVNPDPELLGACITGKVVLVTGAGGSIGSELCRQIIPLEPKELVLFDTSEYALYEVEKELVGLALLAGLGFKIIPLLGSVQDEFKIREVIGTFGVETIYHAAAYKHVPIVEYNVVEGVRNNVLGTHNTALAAAQLQVETFVLVSTDKAVRPTNIMGASKRFAELVLQAFAREFPTTKFCMVRFGNVLGSSGSVVPLFRNQIKSGGPVTLTHQEVTRYFMSISEAAQLVLQASALAEGGDVFVLDMGKPIKIADLARRMIRLMGFSVIEGDSDGSDQDSNRGGNRSGIEIKTIGLRPGEKLYEELLVGNNVVGTGHPMIMRAIEDSLGYSEMKALLQDLNDACLRFNSDAIRQILSQAMCGFDSQHACSDALTQRKQRSNIPAAITGSNVKPLFPS